MQSYRKQWEDLNMAKALVKTSFDVSISKFPNAWWIKLSFQVLQGAIAQISAPGLREANNFLDSSNHVRSDDWQLPKMLS